MHCILCPQVASALGIDQRVPPGREVWFAAAALAVVTVAGATAFALARRARR